MSTGLSVNEPKGDRARHLRLLSAFILHPKSIIFVLSLFVACFVALTGASNWFDESMSRFRGAIRDRPASGQLHVIEIDAKSIAALSNWPWPRRAHAQLVDQLKRAKVSTIAFDVDFSAPSNKVDDATFAAALAAFDGSVILPTFAQAESTQSKARAENLPIASLREHAMLGSVNVRPDRDGMMRDYEFGTITENTPRPSIGALLANVPGKVGETFRIDTSIDPHSIPHHSFIDVLNGSVSSAELAGKSVIIGATAIELGDRYAIPRHGILPGVFVQAMAAETLMGGTQNASFGFMPMLILASLFGAFILKFRRTSAQQYCLVASTMIILLCPLLAESSGIGTFEIAPAIAALAALSIMLTGSRILDEFRRTTLFDQQTGLPNERSLIRTARAMPELVVVAVRLKQFEQLTAILTATQRKQLIERIVDRLSLVFDRQKIFSAAQGTLVIPVPNCDMDAFIEQVEGMAAIFRSPFELDGRNVIVKIAFGIARGTSGSIRQLIGFASFSAVRADEEGHHWNLHNDLVTDEAERAQLLLTDLDAALSNGDIYVVFQPKWSFAEARLCGSEALVRWRHPVLGPVGPDQFIPILESNGRLEELTLHVLDKSIIELNRWASNGLEIGTAINISAPLFGDVDFVAIMLDRIRNAGVPAQFITFEITESATIKSAQQTIEALSAVRLLGARISIDDYGTGQSTLSYLKAFPVDEIKIDQSFVTRMMASQSDQILVRSTIELAHELGFKVVAEGVEDGECFAALSAYNCDTAQGWHVGKPIVADEFFALIVNGSNLPLAQAS